MKTLSTVKKGKAAEHAFLARALMYGLDCYTAATEDGKVDVIVGTKKCQVKYISPTNKAFSVRKMGVNSKTNTKSYWYTEDDVDFFVAVEPVSFTCYIIPIEFIMQFRSSLALSSIGQFANSFSLLGEVIEPCAELSPASTRLTTHYNRRRVIDHSRWNDLKHDKEIRFGKWGWRKRLATKLGISHQYVNRWVKRMDPAFYDEITMGSSS